MPLCGTKKSKKQKRDPSPPYGIEERAKQQLESTTRVENELAAKTKQFNDVENELSKARQQAEKYAEENEKLQRQLKEAHEAAANVDGTAMSVANSIKPEEIELQKIKLVEKEKEVEEKLRKGFEDEKKQLAAEIQNRIEAEKEEVIERGKKLEEDLKQANKTLETERNQRLKTEEEKERFKREKDAIEATLNVTKKELDIANKESHIPRSPTRVPTEEWKSKIQNAEAEFKKEREHRMEKERDISRLHSESELLIKDKERLQEELEKIKAEKDDAVSDMKRNLENTEMSYKTELTSLEDKVADLSKTLTTEGEVKESLLTRLSAATATKVLDGNPNISDLSDPNRPQKLGEQMNQVYDDEWTTASDALEVLDKPEKDIIKTLLDLVTEVYSHCKESAENQLSRIEEDIFLPPMENTTPSSPESPEQVKSPTSKHSMSKIPRFSSQKNRPALPNMSIEKKTIEHTERNGKDKDKSKRSLSFARMKGEKLPEIPAEIRKGVKEYRKRITKQVTPVIEKEIINKLRANPDFGEEVVTACKAYISRCVELCWLMRVQDPPVTLAWNVPEDQTLDGDMYRAYTKNGTHVDYLVWPAMYLYDGGPILMKGVAQGIKQ